MTIVAPQIYSNLSKRNITPGGGGLRGALVETGINIAEIVITNYLTNKLSGKTSIHSETNSRKNKSKTFRHKYSRYRKRKYPLRTNFGKTRSRRKKYYW